MRNVVIICLDSVRKDVYDEEMSQVKNLVDVRLDGCRSASSWSVPSHASFLTGQLPSEHGIHSHNIDFSLLDSEHVVTYGNSFKKTFSISANQFTNKEFGFDQWFDECRTLGSTSYFPSGLDVRTTDGITQHLRESMQHDHPLTSLSNGIVSAIIKMSDVLPIQLPFDNGATSIRRASESVIQESEEPYFLFTNFMEAHRPHRANIRYEGDEEVPNNWSSQEIDLMELNKNNSDLISENRSYISNFRTVYRSAVNYLDTQVLKFIQSIQELSDNETTFVIMSDHGENLGYPDDDHLIGHTASLSEGLLHVPFDIINPPREVHIEDDFFSLRLLPDIIESIRDGDDILINNDGYIEAELIGGGLLNEPDKYLDRMMRVVYNNKTQIKITWDSMGNAYQCYTGGSASSRSEQEPIDEVPDWATNRFQYEITEYKRQAQKEEMGDIDIGAGTKDRLEDLGYL